ncbi:phosphatase PAP2 family protein [Kineococcus sp. NPDC059986]|uniref:phosphatase PAP2 family protein n=1 Tax=Kineococcus sp. NPDC059986 TaxID=3155538 RepID=UPI003450A888
MSAAAPTRRSLLAVGLATPVALLAPARTAQAAPPSTTTTTAFVDSYRTNVPANTTADTNAAVRILSGMSLLWQTGPTWDTGRVLDQGVLRRNVRYCARTTASRTPAQAADAFIADRQDQSYALIAGLGPLTQAYLDGSLAVTSITQAPATTPPTKVEDEVPDGAAAGAATGAGSTDSPLGDVVRLVQTVRGTFASGNPSKAAYQYPRPWRLSPDSTVQPTGRTDALGYPEYRSDVIVVPTLLRQRSTTPESDGGFPSGHTNAFHLAALAYAHAVPERYQALVARALDRSHLRIVAGMHSPLDVLGGRVLATALAAATLADPANTALKNAARATALAWFEDATGTDATGLVELTASDRDAVRAQVLDQLTLGFPRTGPRRAMVVPQGAEVLLETRHPYLDAGQRREVLRTTALPAGYPVLDGPELWGRLNLFDAADGYGRFDRTVEVTMDAAAGGFSATDVWRNDVDGSGGLVKCGSGRLTLTGRNSFRGGVRVEAGTLVAGSATALGRGDVDLRGGTLELVSDVRAGGGYEQAAGTVLRVAVGGRHAPLSVDGTAALAPGSRLEVEFGDDCRVGEVRPVLSARSVRGGFAAVTVVGGGRAELVTTRQGVGVRRLAG